MRDAAERGEHAAHRSGSSGAFPISIIRSRAIIITARYRSRYLTLAGSREDPTSRRKERSKIADRVVGKRAKRVAFRAFRARVSDNDDTEEERASCIFIDIYRNLSIVVFGFNVVNVKYFEIS